MKKIIILFLVLLTGTLYSQEQQPLNLDTTLSRTSRYVENALQQGTIVAVLNFDSPSEEFSNFVIEEITGNLVTGRKVTIVDRNSLMLIREEMNLQLSGEVSDESAQRIGRMLGAQSIVSGSLTDMGTYYRFRVKVINVETAAIQAQGYLNLQKSEQVAFLLGNNPPSSQPTARTSTQGIIVPGANLSEKLTWLARSGDSHNTYILEINSNETIESHTFEFRGGINITVILRGVGSNRVIRLRSHGYMFQVQQNVTFVLDNNITLQGHNSNNSSLIYVNGGTFKMNNGSNITGNIISNNEGGGVYIYHGLFEMNGGTISGNLARYGGGVYVSSGTFTMRGGTITGNTARVNGGGVYINSGAFTKSGGTITGYNSDRNNGNAVKDIDDYILARSGHAVWVNLDLRKETTAGSRDNMTYGSNRSTTGAWDR